jgi:hypothetical protein
MAVYTAFLFATMLATLLLILFWTGAPSQGVALVDQLLQVFIWGALLSGFAANALGRIQPAR